MPSQLVYSKGKKKLKVTQPARKNKALEVTLLVTNTLKHQQQLSMLENMFLSCLEKLLELS